MALLDIFNNEPNKKNHTKSQLKKDAILERVDFYVKMANQLWGYINKIFVEVLSFSENIIGYFNQLLSGRKLDKDVLALSIKENLDNGNYRTVNCLYNQKKGEVIDLTKSSIGIDSHKIDQQTREAFGERNMIILK